MSDKSGVHQWTSRSAKSLMEITGSDDPVDAMRQLVQDLLSEAEQACPPVDLRLVASFRGIVDVSPTLMKETAIIVLSREGLKVFVNASDPEGRRNFSTAHEICHTLFPDFAAHPYRKRETLLGEFNPKHEEEYLCDIGASHLLLPPDLVASRVSSNGLRLESVFRLAEDFGSSIEAAAIAWAHAAPWQASIVFFEEGIKPSEAKRKYQLVLPGLESDFALKPELRVSLVCASSDFPIFLPKYKSVKHDGPIYQSLASQTQCKGYESLELRDGERKVYAESFFAPYKKQGVTINRVVGLLAPR